MLKYISGALLICAGFILVVLALVGWWATAVFYIVGAALVMWSKTPLWLRITGILALPVIAIMLTSILVMGIAFIDIRQ